MTCLPARVRAPNAGLMTGTGTNCYVVGGDDVAVIDVGCSQRAHLDAIEEVAGGRLKWILLTHAHSDHSPGAHELAARTGAQVFAWGSSGRFPGVPCRPDVRIRDGWTLRLGDQRVTAIHTPGHAKDHLCYLLEPDGLLFSGDHIMQGSTVVIAPPDGDMRAYLASLKRLLDFRIKRIAPGHGEWIDCAHDEIRKLIAHRLKREGSILTALAEQRLRLPQIVAAVYPALPEALKPWAELSAWAHLRKLRDEGRVIGTSRRGRWRLA